MPTKKYIVRLISEEREYLQSIVRAGRTAAYRRTHAQILLKADSGMEGPAWIDAQIAEAMDLDPSTVANLRRRLVEEGIEAAVGRKKLERPCRPRKLDGVGEAHLIATACSKPPDGRARWTLQLLADRMVELKLVEGISREAVRRTLKKTRSNRT
jgi:hypothetical protein